MTLLPVTGWIFVFVKQQHVSFCFLATRHQHNIFPAVRVLRCGWLNIFQA